MEDIAALAEVSKATIYIYFRSKKDFYYGIVEATYGFYRQSPDAYRLGSRYKALELLKLLSRNKLDRLKRLMKANLMQLEKTVTKGMSQDLFTAMYPCVTAVIFSKTSYEVVKI